MSKKELAPCGTPAARKRHRKRGETCEACAPKPRVLAACGTKSAKARHKAHGEECAECAPKGRAKYGCGTAQARRRHARKNETCVTCDTAKTAAHEKTLAPCGTRQARQRHRNRGETCTACTPPNRESPCGTKAATARHKRRNETCTTCETAANARIKPLAPCGTKQARQRHYRAGQACETCDAAKTTTSNRPLQPCGTHAAAQRHRAHGEPLCEPCRKANAERAATQRRQQGITERLTLDELIDEIRFLLHAGEGTHRILQATGYVGRENTLRLRLQSAGEHTLATAIFNPWDLAA